MSSFHTSEPAFIHRAMFQAIWCDTRKGTIILILYTNDTYNLEQLFVEALETASTAHILEIMLHVVYGTLQPRENVVGSVVRVDQ